MNIEINESLIRRNTRIAQITVIAGLAVLIGGMVISFRRPDLFTISFASLLIGFLLSQVGIYFSNRWGRRPRPYELLNQALKGLDGKYTIYHYITPASHLLVGPAGIWVLTPRHQRGTITYSNGRWHQRGGNMYMKIFAQEGLGRPDLEISNEIENLEKYLSKRMQDDKIPKIQAALVFTNDKTVIDVDNEEDSPMAVTLPLGKLKEFIRKTAKTKPVSMDKIQQIQEVLCSE
jgi:hypothetical protein